jgi:hypothetical protein
MRFEKIIQRRIRKHQQGVQLDMNVNAAISANVDRSVVPAS